eukprot:Gb_37749 [translate_table: standard]
MRFAFVSLKSLVDFKQKHFGMRLKLYFHRFLGISKKKLIGDQIKKLRNFWCRCRSVPIVFIELSSSIQNYLVPSLLCGGYDNYLQLGASQRRGSRSMGLMISKLKNVRVAILVLAVSYILTVSVAITVAAAAPHDCLGELVLPAAVIATAAAVRIMWMFGSGLAQAATALTMLGQQTGNPVVQNAVRHERRMRYRRWIWWSRFGTLMTVVQVLGATYLTVMVVKNSAYGHKSASCYLGQEGHGADWKQILVIVLAIVAWILAIAQFCAGSDVLAWRSFYSTHDRAWRAHYHEMFDHGIREVLCCLGRGQYLSVLEEDEVDSVAGLLGDLVAYRAAGAGHLEFLAGVALLQRQAPTLPPLDQFTEAPEAQIQEAVLLHPFAEAAYTGPLLDVGRNPLLFPCAWLYRQGVLTPWSRSRRPILEGDNWWRGHAAAFLKYVNLPPDALRKGRVHQAKREATYFAVVAHHLRCIIIAVRGTETPEDLLTDGLCRECMLSEADLNGLLNSNALAESVKQHVATSFPHFGHSGIVEAARELCMQLDGILEDGDKKSSGQTFGRNDVATGSEDASYHQKTGFLDSLLGPGGECQGYSLRLVGHSLGGAIGALAGIMLYHRYPNLHVYAYGVLPCVDAIVAEACSSFVTSIIYNDEFSARLSVTSILRLREAALSALAADSSTDSAMISKFARRLLHANKYLRGKNSEVVSVQTSRSGFMNPREKNHRRRRRHFEYKIKGGIFLCAHASSCMAKMSHLSSTRPMRNGNLEIHSVECTLHASLEGGLLNDGKHCDLTADADKIKESLSFGNKTCKHESSSDEQTSALAAGAESREKVSFEESTVLIDNSDTENQGTSEEDTNHTEDCNVNDWQTPSSKDTITENAIAGNLTVQPICANSGPDMVDTEPAEVFIPGLVIHIVPETKQDIWPFCRSWKWLHGGEHCHRAILRHRESFKDIVVSPSMFLDHMPWRCHYAMQKVLETWNSKGHGNNDILDARHMV